MPFALGSEKDGVSRNEVSHQLDGRRRGAWENPKWDCMLRLLEYLKGKDRKKGKSHSSPN